MSSKWILHSVLRVIISSTFVSSIKTTISVEPPTNCLIHLVFPFTPDSTNNNRHEEDYEIFLEKFLFLNSGHFLLKDNSLLTSSLEFLTSEKAVQQQNQIKFQFLSKKGNSCVTFMILSPDPAHTKNIIGTHISLVQNNYFWFYILSLGNSLVHHRCWNNVKWSSDPKLLLISLDKKSWEVKQLSLFCQTCKHRVTPIFPSVGSSLLLNLPLINLETFPSQTYLLTLHNGLRKSSLQDNSLQIQYIPQPDSELENCLDESKNDIYFRDSSSCNDLQAILSVIMRKQLNMTLLEKTDFTLINDECDKKGPQICYSCSPYEEVLPGTSVITEDIGFRTGFYCTYTSETQKPSLTFLYKMVSPSVMILYFSVLIAIAVIHKNPAFVFEASYIVMMQRPQRKWRRDFYTFFAPCLILLSFIYQASMTTEVVVPLKDKVIESMPALLKAGYRFALGNEEIVQYLAFNFGHIFLKWDLDLSTDLFIIDEDFKLGPQLLPLLAKHHSLSSVPAESPFVKYLRSQKSYDQSQSHSDIKCHCVEKDEHFGTQLLFFKGGLSDKIIQTYITYHELGIHKFWKSTLLLDETAKLIPGLLAISSSVSDPNRNLDFQKLKMNSNLIVIFWFYISWMTGAFVIFMLQILHSRIKKLLE